VEGFIAIVGRKMERDLGSKGSNEHDVQPDGQEHRALEIYKKKVILDDEAEIEDGMLELDLDEDEVVEVAEQVGIAVYYSRKSLNPQILFLDMLQAWSIQKLVSVDRIRDYIFKVEFPTEEKGGRGRPMEA
jgi:hypothetical protein